MSATATSWGWQGRYYAEEPHVASSGWPRANRPRPKPPPGHAEAESRWEELLERATPGVKDKVTRAYRQWNNIVRDCLRTETALRLTVGDDAQAVPVRIVDGMPIPFAGAVQGLRGQEWLLLNRPLVEGAARGVKFLGGIYAQAHRLLCGASPHAEAMPSEGEIRKVRWLASKLLRVLRGTEALQRIRLIDEDVLGAYFLNLSEIRLYWVVIGIVAATLGVAVEALTLVVLAHELAHAYTHLGRDIDSQRWETPAFASADLRIVEGLAQFYTAAICKQLHARAPNAWTAYERLLKLQSETYRAHRAWVKDGESGGEIVRVAMIECRSRKITDAEEFVQAIKRLGGQVRGQKPASR